MFPGKTVYLRESAHIGHGAVIHGAEVGRNVLVGMNSVVMDNVVIGKESIIGAMTFVREGTEIPERSLCVGNPAKVIKQVSDEMLEWKTKGTKLYQTLPADCYESLKPVQPLREVPDNPPSQSVLFETWNRIKGDN
jgi:carbonic anhydrase/acetyltransferase-like protein (isoleucine patch superfamily)